MASELPGTPPSFASPVAAWTRRSRRSGSGSSQGSSTNMNEIRLPWWSAPSSRTLTGTMVLSGIGAVPRSFSRRRTAPAAAAR